MFRQPKVGAFYHYRHGYEERMPYVLFLGDANVVAPLPSLCLRPSQQCYIPQTGCNCALTLQSVGLSQLPSNLINASKNNKPIRLSPVILTEVYVSDGGLIECYSAIIGAYILVT